LKAYRWHDGRAAFIVAAANQREAVELFRTSLYDFRNFGGVCTEAEAAIALSSPGIVFKRSIGGREAYVPR
jgi:hypothetical protein